MRVTYLRLENVAGISVGSDKDFIEIDFVYAKNSIITIQGMNGVGKTVLLSSITPFAYLTSLDERSTLSYIIIGKNGYKEIQYQNGEDLYIIKHYFKATKDTHSVKSYFIKNGIELNENGNVTSFLSLVESHFGLTMEMMRLLRLGSNVNSFITLPPARRKEYIGRLIEEIDLYIKIYRKINDDLRLVKVLLSSNGTNLHNCHLQDLVVEEERLRKLNKELVKCEKERDEIVRRIGKIEAIEKANNIEELQRKQQEAKASLLEFNRIETLIQEASLQGTSIESLIKKRNGLSDTRIDRQSRLHSYRISIDNTLKSIERLETSIRKISSNNDIESLISLIDTLKNDIRGGEELIRGFVPSGCRSEEVSSILSRLQSFNQISQMIYTFGKRPINLYLELKKNNKDVDRFLNEQKKKNFARLGNDDIRRLLEQVFQGEQIITPNCTDQYQHCPYYRLFDIVDEIKTKLEEESYDDETLRYLQVITGNIDNILNEIDRILLINIPSRLKDSFREKFLFDRLNQQLPFFDLSELQEYLSLLREYEVFKEKSEKLKGYEYQLSIYKSSGIDVHLKEITTLKENITFYQENIKTIEGELIRLDNDLKNVDDDIGLVTRYNDGKKYQKIVEETLRSTEKLLEPLESSKEEKRELNFSLQNLNNIISTLRTQIKDLENLINEYKRLVAEREKLMKKHKDLEIILEAVSTRKGIPVLYMNTYLSKIQKMANNLLSIVYGDRLRLSKFNVTPESFEIPFKKNGRKVPDVRYASQSEVPLITMALSFALANKASGIYNILLLDEIDAGFDEENRSSFLKMLDEQMREIHAEQAVVISHNLIQMINLPMDVIRLSDIGFKSKLQNIIYE